MKTVFARPGTVRGDWFVVDASDKTLGRLASQIAHRLKGKHKADYSPHVDMGDHIVVVNAQKIRVTGRKLSDKIYYHHTGHIGSAHVCTPVTRLDRMHDPDRINAADVARSEEHTSELQSPDHIVCRLLLEKKKKPD